MNAHTPFDANQDWSNPYCQNRSNDPMVDALLGNAYHVVRTVYCNLGNLKLIYDFLNQYGMVLGVQSEAELKALTTKAKYARIYGFLRAGDRQVTDYLYVEGDRTGIIPDDPEATGSWITVATSGSAGGGTSSGEGAYIPWVYSNGSATGGETSINVPDGTVGVPFIIVNGDIQYVGRGFEFNVENLSVTLAQPLEEGDEVVFLLTGTPAVPDNPNVSDWVQINWLYNGGYASGGEQVIQIPYTFKSVPAIYKNGARYYSGLAENSYTVDADNQRIILTEPLATNDRLIVQLGGESAVLEISDRTLQEVGRSTNQKDSQVILSSDTTQVLNGKTVVYDVIAQKIYGLPTLPTNVYISSVSNGKLTYNPGNVTVSLLAPVNSAELFRNELTATTGATIVMTPQGSVQDVLDSLTASLANLNTISNRVFHVDHYGAVGDGVITDIGLVTNTISGTNDAAAIQAAIDACKAAGGGIVRFTAGKQYRLDWTVFYSSNMDIDFNGCYILWNAPTVAKEASFLLSEHYDKGDDTNWVENVKIHDLAGLRCRYLGGNGIGMPKTRYARVYNIKTDYCWLHTVDATGTKFLQIDNVHCRGSSQLAHLQVDTMAGQKSVSGAAQDGSWLYCAFDATQAASWCYADTVVISNCSAQGSQYAGIHIHNQSCRRVVLDKCSILSNLRGVHTDNDGRVNDMWIINSTVRANTSHQLYLQAHHNGLWVMGCTIASDDRTLVDDLVTMRAAASDSLRRDVTFAFNHFAGATRGMAIQFYNNVHLVGNKFRAMGSGLTSSDMMEVTNYGVSFYQCSHVINDGSMFLDCTLDTCCYHNTGSHHTVTGLNCQASYAALKANAITNLYVGPNFSASHASAVVAMAFQSITRLLVSGVYSFASGPLTSVYLNSCASPFLQGNTLNGTDVTGKGIVANNSSDVRTESNNIRSFITAIEAAGTSTVVSHEPFVPAANLIKSGTGSITYNTFTTATK